MKVDIIVFAVVDFVTMTSTVLCQAIWRASWQGAVVLLLVGALCRLFPKLPAAARCWLWRLALLKILLALVPLVAFEPLALRLLPSSTPEIWETLPSSKSAFSKGALEAKGREITPDLSHERTEYDPAVTMPVRLWIPPLLMLLYGAGVGRGMVGIFRARFKAQRLYQSSEPLNEAALTRHAAILCARLGMHTVPELRVSSRIRLPLLTAVPRAAIILPLVSEDSSEESPGRDETLRLMLAHELAHLKRGDLFWNGFGALMQMLFFFHPLVFLARREEALAREIACDSLALQITDSPTAAYGAMLVRAATGKDVRNSPLTDAALTLGILDSLHSLKQRLIAMQNIPETNRRWRLGTAALLGIVAFVLLPWHVVARGDETPTAPRIPVDSQHDDRTDLLPLRPGNWWDMNAVGEGRTNEDRYQVVAPVTKGNISVYQMRHGKPWRREIYQKKAGGLFLAAHQDERGALMRYNPPIPLLKEPVSVGAVISWQGKCLMENKMFPAHAQSTISANEAVTTKGGRFNTFRVDTLVRVMWGEHEIRFPSVRWLAPHVGYVRRASVENGLPVHSELQKVHIKQVDSVK
jgi:beta-lactamase regulating signal transducer with metallopeptidase domain